MVRVVVVSLVGLAACHPQPPAYPALPPTCDVDRIGQVAIETTSNADTPFASGGHCILTIDVWEHAYYVDYRNARPKYVEEFWKLVNWSFANKNFG